MKNYVKLICDLPFLPEYIIQIRNLKQVLNHRLILKKVHRVIKFNQNAWLKAYVDMNTKLRKKVNKKLRKTLSGR